MSDATRDEYDRVNRAHWDELAELHRTGGAYRVEPFLAGECVLDPVVRAEIGDVAGMSIVHLQCHFGLDTLSLARLGATVTGVDYSAKGIALARALSRESGVPARFVECRVEEAATQVEGPFDMAYVTWGAINWLPDLVPWARTIERLLRPGGLFYMAECHPLAQAIDLDERGEDGTISIRYPCVGRGKAQHWRFETDFADERTRVTHADTWEWNHGLGEVLAAILGAGLRLTYFKERPILAWRSFPGMVERDAYFYGLPADLPAIPLSFSLKAVKD